MAKSKTYQCPGCGNSITVHVTPTHPPTCSNHTGGGKVMVEKK
jgi:endogenous inhibitor of DNA gyrase (YacG/DUF329 family)